MSNVIYFEPVVENIKKMSCCYENTDNVYTESDNKHLGMDKQKHNTNIKSNRCNSEEDKVVHLNVIGDPFSVGTYTENTREIITETTTDNNICKEVIDYLNLKTGKNYSEFTKSTKELIIAKQKAGYTKKELLKVIDNKVFSWGGTIYEKYLRPTTLFGDKFDEYLNEEQKDYSKVRGYKKSSFCNFTQRPYDGSDGGMTIEELEKKLLGW